MFLLSLWLNHWLNEIRSEYRLSSYSTSKMDAHTHTNTLSFSLSWPGALVCVVPWMPKSSVDIFKHGAVWMLFFPSFHNMMCFLFCVCFDPSLAAKLRCGEARVRVALLCYFWQQQWLVAVEERGDRRGIVWSPKTRGCLKDFCLKELLCNDQRLVMDVCVCALVRECTRKKAGMHIRSFNTSQTPHIHVLIHRPHTRSCCVAQHAKYFNFYRIHVWWSRHLNLPANANVWPYLFCSCSVPVTWELFLVCQPLW